VRRRAGPLATSLLVGAAISTAAVANAADPATADCSGPTVRSAPLEVAAGDEVTITGEAMGDNCYDTGPPPAGQGALGKPLRDLEVVVQQGDAEHVLARGGADEDYAFEVTVTVPADLEPGEAVVLVRHRDGDQVSAGQPLSVRDGPDVGQGAGVAAVEVVEFGPEDDDDPVQVPDRPRRARAGDGPGTGLILLTSAFALALVAGVALAVAAWHRREIPPRS
jgi:hypothetical protein